MKDEAAGMVIKEFFGLRSKMYLYEINIKTTKNVREYLNIERYYNILSLVLQKNALYEIN